MIDLNNKTDQEIIQAGLAALALSPDPNADDLANALLATRDALARLLTAADVPVQDIMAALEASGW